MIFDLKTLPLPGMNASSKLSRGHSPDHVEKGQENKWTLKAIVWISCFFTPPLPTSIAFLIPTLSDCAAFNFSLLQLSYRSSTKRWFLVSRKVTLLGKVDFWPKIWEISCTKYTEDNFIPGEIQFT